MSPHRAGMPTPRRPARVRPYVLHMFEQPTMAEPARLLSQVVGR